MRRVFILMAASFCAASQCAIAQSHGNDRAASMAASIAAQQAAEERYKRMAADIEALQMDEESMKAKIASLDQKVNDLRQIQASAAANRNNGVQEDLKRLALSIVAVDRKREEDKQAISEQIRKSIGTLQKTLATVPVSIREPAPVREPTPKSQADIEVPVIENGNTYIVQGHQTLCRIVENYNTECRKKGWKPISLRQAKEANPNVDWNHLRVGQKIVLPKEAARS